MGDKDKNVIIPAVFDDCEAIQVVNGVPALVIQDKDGTDELFNVPASEFIRRTGISERILKDLSVLLGLPIYWMQSDPLEDAHRFVENPTVFTVYQAQDNTLLARGANFSTSESSFGARLFTIALQYSLPYEDGEDGLVSLTRIDEPTVNNQDKTVDVSENGTIEITPDEGFTGLGKVTINTEVEGAKPKWTGHADAEGLKAIGWTDEDIAYYQENGVNWNEEDDEWHKVSDDNKALYGVLTASNISTYKNRIAYLPKIDTSKVTSMLLMFGDCSLLTAIPMLDTSKVTSMQAMFSGCSFLTSIPMLDTSNVTSMGEMFSGCRSLTSIPMLDTSNVTNMSTMFSYCISLTSIPMLDTSNVTNMYNIFGGCRSLTAIPMLDTSKVTSMQTMFSGCSSLTHANLKNVKLAYDLSAANLLSKSSLLYIINNEAATSAITIKLASYAYDKWATDPDIVAALANHPNISISK